MNTPNIFDRLSRNLPEQKKEVVRIRNPAV